jgi:hypothetical protein
LKRNFSDLLIEQKRARYVKGNMAKAVDSYRHTFHPKLYTSNKDRGGKKEKERIIQRAEAAHLILKVFSKLGQKWKRKPTILPGWKDSL